MPDGVVPPGRSQTGETLVLAGSIVGLCWLVVSAFSIWMMLSLMPAMMDSFEASGGPSPRPFFERFTLYWGVMMGAFVALSIVGALLGFSARREIQESGGTRGTTKAIVGGALMLPGALVGGILALIGGILCNVARTEAARGAVTARTSL